MYLILLDIIEVISCCKPMIVNQVQSAVKIIWQASYLSDMFMLTSLWNPTNCHGLCQTKKAVWSCCSSDSKSTQRWWVPPTIHPHKIILLYITKIREKGWLNMPAPAISWAPQCKIHVHVCILIVTTVTGPLKLDWSDCHSMHDITMPIGPMGHYGPASPQTSNSWKQSWILWL